MAANLATRLAALERDRRDGQPVEIKVYWPDKLMPCAEHLDCDIERATGEHIKGVVHIRW